MAKSPTREAAMPDHDRFHLPDPARLLVPMVATGAPGASRSAMRSGKGWPYRAGALMLLSLGAGAPGAGRCANRWRPRRKELAR